MQKITIELDDDGEVYFQTGFDIEETIEMLQFAIMSLETINEA